MIENCTQILSYMYHIIVNSLNIKGKNANKLNIVKAVFDRSGKQYEIHMTEHRGHAREIAAEISRYSSDLHIIAMGGDGTLHEVLNGIEDPSTCHLGLIPLGTGIDFAVTAGIPTDDVKCAAEIIVFKAPTAVDYLELSNGVRAINAVGYGMDVDVLRRAYSRKGTSRNKYFRAFVRSLMHYKAKPFQVVCDGKRSRHNGIIACIGNGRQIGSGIKLLPDADISDGYLDLIVVNDLSRWKTMVAFLKLMHGKLADIREATKLRGKQAVIIPEEDTFTVQAEGELYDVTDNAGLTVKVVSGKLLFYLPKND